MKHITIEDLEGLNHKQLVTFAVFCARQVEHLITSEEAKRCLEVTELWLDGKATSDECRTTVHATNAAIYAANAARAAGYAAYTADDDDDDWAADDAVNAAWAAAYAGDNKEELIKQQHNYLYELKNIDKILEEELLS